MSKHQICEQARLTRCNHCHVPPGRLCACGTRGVCLCRVIRAGASGLMPWPEATGCIDDGLAEAGGVGTVLDPEVTR
jgi:hypothetical protein